MVDFCRPGHISLIIINTVDAEDSGLSVGITAAITVIAVVAILLLMVILILVCLRQTIKPRYTLAPYSRFIIYVIMLNLEL